MKRLIILAVVAGALLSVVIALVVAAWAAATPVETPSPERHDGVFMRTVLHGSLSAACPVRGTSRYDRDFYSAEKATVLYGFDWCDLKALCLIESGLDPLARSPARAKGLCQLLAGTFAEVHPAGDIWNPVDNLHAAAAEMARNLGFWSWRRTPEEREELAIASYNAGRGRMANAQADCGMALTLAGMAACTPAESVEHVRRWKLALEGRW